MNVLEVNFTDLDGRIFNGYDLHLSLNEIEGVNALQYVLNKDSTTESVRVFCSDPIIHQELLYLEQKNSISQLLAPYGRQLLREEAFRKADVVHLHILHNDVISLLDLPEIMDRDNVVWTIHDPWAVTGNCIHPLECRKWRTGCCNCEKLELPGRKMSVDNTSQMWKLKQKIFSRINPYIVVASDFMRKYIEESPLTSHWNRIFQIPFGVKEKYFETFSQKECRRRFGISMESFVIGFRMQEGEIKGCRYLLEALENLSDSLPIHLFAVGNQILPERIRRQYSYTGPVWFKEEDMIDFYRCLDVFVMPSLAESFGMMAIEAMACETAVICFKSTALEKITHAPEYGIAVEYKSSRQIGEAIRQLITDRNKLIIKKEQGKRFVERTYSYTTYVSRHLKLYEKIQKEAYKK
ncbi:glycosyltransferase [Clostridium porci]|uniref:Glycosyltransferase n=1 Tax=Clostridium porci TaxID=2605778 RepID=A0A7X2NIN9_9CLOT|nr:glycosyltransferase [Clostridium porci]MSS35098.1 glycosyltransferase [Clostridium porci]